MKYYVYAYNDYTLPEQHGGYQFSGRPFYVGYGSLSRFLFHLNEARKVLAGKPPTRLYNPHKTRKICKMLESGIEPRIDILKTGLTKDQAKLEEKRLIAIIPNLTNIANGGEGGDTLSKHPRAGNWGDTFKIIKAKTIHYSAALAQIIPNQSSIPLFMNLEKLIKLLAVKHLTTS
ncbi:LEM-3-like GIY-YIG domain-containing protein [Acinetobacter sp.]|uniref:LEM-3-like GIY-YIG domain-containing protein n=1 Tax=Acinetobacter sp. TaxID=472 RepID=UPI00388E2BBD